MLLRHEYRSFRGSSGSTCTNHALRSATYLAHKHILVVQQIEQRRVDGAIRRNMLGLTLAQATELRRYLLDEGSSDPRGMTHRDVIAGALAKVRR